MAKKVHFLIVLALLATLAAGVAEAGVITFAGNTTGQPTWQRATSGYPPVGLSSSTPPYEAWLFSVDLAGSYQMEITVAGWDTYLHLYQHSFNPTSQFTNILAGDDDSGVGLLSLISYSLNPGTQYTLVVSGFGSGSSGPYTAEIRGPGNIELGNVVIPEPTTAVLIAAGLTSIWFLRRRRFTRN
jgi:hypothetical protein